MSLMDIFRSLIGERDGALSTQQGFQSQPDSNGLNFYLPLPAFKALQTGQGSALEKIQLIVLNMLVEQGLPKTRPTVFTSVPKILRGWILSRRKSCVCRDACQGTF